MAFDTLVADYETYYDADFSLRKMGTEEYIMDPRFCAHGCAVKFNQEPSRFLTHSETKAYFSTLNWQNIILIGHKLMFDGAITVWRYHHTPALFADTLGLANIFIRPHTGRVGLDVCAGYEGLPLKTNILGRVKALSTNQIVSSGLWNDFAKYACVDADNAYHIWRKYYPQISNVQKMVLSWTTMNYTRGRLLLDLGELEEAANAVEEERNRLLAEAGLDDPALLRSTTKLAAHLNSLGIKVEFKEGKNGEIPAFGKDDPFVRMLLQHSDPFVVAAIKARLAHSSSGEYTRARRLARMARATKGKMLIPMQHAAAHTGRPGGTDGVNPTNFRHGSPIRKAIKAPPREIIVTVDQSQGEVRVIAWLAQCQPMLNALGDPTRDLYCEYGQNILYGEPVYKGTPRRQICKVECLALQYGVGGETLYNRCLANGVALSRREAYDHVDKYRNGYPEILENGYGFCELLRATIGTNKEISWKGCNVTKRGIQLPSQRWIEYPQMQMVSGELVYFSAKYKSWQKLYPGSVNENLGQSIVNDLVSYTLVKYYDDTVMWDYDSVSRLVPVEIKDQVAEQTRASMMTNPPWAAGLPLMSEAKFRSTLE